MKAIAKVKQGDYFFVDIPPKGIRWSRRDETDDRLVDECIRSKLLANFTGPFKVTSCSDQTVTTLENGVENTASVVNKSSAL